MRSRIFTAVLLLTAASTDAADIEAGKAKVQAVCAACHGASGVSVSDGIPNLAAQKAAYIEAQLKALKDGSRKSAIMSAIASQLTSDDIANVAAYFASLPGASAATRERRGAQGSRGRQDSSRRFGADRRGLFGQARCGQEAAGRK
jgi:cytochrome c553